MSEKTGRVRRWNGCTCSDGYRCNVNCPCGAPTKSGVCVCFSVSRLTSERDEAVRVAGELRAKADLADRMWALLAARYQETGAMFIDEITDWLACYDSLTASTGGSSDEPQKEIRE